MTRIVTLQLEGFVGESLGRLTRQGSSSSDGVLRTAALYYLNDRDAGRTAWRAPRFRPAGERGEGLSVTLDDETWAALHEEAQRQGVTVEALAVHALLYYVADLESGRLGARLRDVLDDEEGPAPTEREP